MPEVSCFLLVCFFLFSTLILQLILHLSEVLCCLCVAAGGWWYGEYSDLRLISDSLWAGNAIALIIEPRWEVDAVLLASSAKFWIDTWKISWNLKYIVTDHPLLIMGCWIVQLCGMGSPDQLCSWIRKVHVNTPSTHVLMPPKLGALREVACDNIYPMSYFPWKCTFCIFRIPIFKVQDFSRMFLNSILNSRISRIFSKRWQPYPIP